MPAYFLDSSALVKGYRREDGTERILALLSGPDRSIISRLAQAEVSAAIVRRGRSTAVSDEQLNAVLTELDREIADTFTIVELDTAIMARASELTRIHSLRAADAIQLASALEARNSDPQQQLTLVGSGIELNEVAKAEGLSILDPTRA